MSADPRRVPVDVVPANGWHRVPGEPVEDVGFAGDDAEHEITVYYSGDDGRFAEETYYIAVNRAGRLSLWQISHVGQWAPDDPEHEGEPLFEEYAYDCLGLYDYDSHEGRVEALKERDRFAAGDESDSYTF